MRNKIDVYDTDGYNQDGYDKNGYNKDGYNRFGFNRNGYDAQGYNENGYDRDGYNRRGYNKNGYNREGYNCWGFDEDGYNRNGYNEDGYDCNGLDCEGYNENGIDAEGFSREPNFNHISGHHLKPRPIFYQTKNDIENPLYMGFELEIDEGGEKDSIASNVCFKLNNKVYCKHDGSLNQGFEIVSYPATLNYHVEQKENYKVVFNYLLSKNYISHDAETCGLHIHVNKNFFGDSELQVDYNISKILYVFEKFWDKFVTFSRRTERSLQRWARNYRFDISNDLIANLKIAKGQYERYFSVNLQNEHTIEFRMFRGTLNINTFMATLQLINCICNFVKNIDIEKLQQVCFDQIVKSNFAELNEYLQRKKLKEVFFEGEEVLNIVEHREEGLTIRGSDGLCV